MSKPEFDQFADRYDDVLEDAIPDALQEDGYFAEYKIALMAAQLAEEPPQRVLDFGCGSGRSLPFLERYFPRGEIVGFDLSRESLAAAAARAPRAKLYSDWNDVAQRPVDAILAANVFHHIPPSERESALIRCREALADGGAMFLFEHNPLNPLTRRVFERCPFDVDAEMLDLTTTLQLAERSGFRTTNHGYTLFFPRPLAFLRGLEPSLRWLPLGAQYFVRLEHPAAA